MTISLEDMKNYLTAKTTYNNWYKDVYIPSVTSGDNTGADEGKKAGKEKK